MQLTERLGFGIHGVIFAGEDNPKVGKTAIKAHRYVEPYLRELDVYKRLKEAQITRILGFHLPQLLGSDDDLRVIKMSVVTRPFVLDFAGAYLDQIPEFPEETWAQWKEDKKDQFGSRWPKVQEVLGELEELGIYMVDVTPSNVAF